MKNNIKETFICRSCGKIRIKNLRNFSEVCRYCRAKQKREQTCLEKYGAKNPLSCKKIQEKVKQTNLEKYGTENPFGNTEIRDQIKSTFIKKYGVENPNQNKTIREKAKQTCLERYGVENPFQSEEFRIKANITCLEKYGKTSYSQTEVFKNARKDFYANIDNLEKTTTLRQITNLKKFGYSNPRKSPIIKEKIKQVLYKKYGAYNYSQTKQAQLNRRSRYQFDNLNFDSFPELCFYIFQKEDNQNIKRCEKSFNYTFNDIEHSYFPDFEIIDKDGNSQFFELKGDQFLTESGKWQNPFDHSQDEFYEAKHRCAIQNNVHILYQKDYQKYIDYVKQKYTKEQLQSFKVEKKQTN